MSPLLTRTISGSIYVAIIVGCILTGPGGVLWLAEALAILAGVELSRNLVGLRKRRTVPLILDLAGLMVLAEGKPSLLLIWIAIICLRLVAELYCHDSNPVRSLCSSFFMQIYLGLPMFLMSFTAEKLSSEGGSFPCIPILVVFIFIWLNDTGAYVVGSLCGRHKMIERISPKKTWEGFFGGIAFCLIFALLCAFFWAPAFNMASGIWKWLGLGALTGAFATWGDLVESLIKRSLGVKDSGHLIPGHGGILDRIDSFLLVMPAAFLYFLLTGICAI